MGYLSDYIKYYSGTEVPESYAWWSGLSILGHILGKKVWVMHGDYFPYHGNIFVCLVGDPGSGKNTGMAVNIKTMINHFPHMLMSASIQSREDIADLMAEDRDATDTVINPAIWKNDKGEIQEYRSFYILNNELASFLSVDKIKMVEFLTDVYDTDRFSTGFKGQRQKDPKRKQWFSNPHVSLLAGAVPEWFMGSLRMDLFSGGLGRRLIIVYAKRDKIIPNPIHPVGATEALLRAVDHLKAAEKQKGEVKRDANAMKWWNEWYLEWKKKKPLDPILSQFHETKNMQLLKLALLLVMTEQPFTMVMTAEHLQAALALLERLEEPIIKLTSGIGRNELAGIGRQLIDFLDRTGGMQTQENVRKQFRRYLDMPDFRQVLDDLVSTHELVIDIVENPGKPGTPIYCTMDGWKDFQKIREQAQKERLK